MLSARLVSTLKKKSLMAPQVGESHIAPLKVLVENHMLKDLTETDSNHVNAADVT